MVIAAVAIADLIVGRDDRWIWILVAAVPALLMALIPERGRGSGDRGAGQPDPGRPDPSPPGDHRVSPPENR